MQIEHVLCQRHLPRGQQQRLGSLGGRREAPASGGLQAAQHLHTAFVRAHLLGVRPRVVRALRERAALAQCPSCRRHVTYLPAITQRKGVNGRIQEKNSRKTKKKSKKEEEQGNRRGMNSVTG